jgi:HK97 family phage prohead protease
MRTKHLAFELRELKLAPDESGAAAMSFSGYGAAFNNVDAYGDVIVPGAFAQFIADAKSGRQPWPAMLSQHGGWGLGADDITPVGVWKDLSEDGVGLKVEGKLADTPRGRELHTLMKMEPRAAIDGLSIGYIAKEWEPRSKPEDPRRKLKRVDLIEISPVTFPANRLARVASVKSVDELVTLGDIEDYLREAGGFSRGEAKGLIARIKAAGPREADDELQACLHAIKQQTLNLKGAIHG